MFLCDRRTTLLYVSSLILLILLFVFTISVCKCLALSFHLLFKIVNTQQSASQPLNTIYVYVCKHEIVIRATYKLLFHWRNHAPWSIVH